MSAKPASNAPLTFRRAAEALGQEDASGRALKAMVLAREAQIGKPIASRMAGKKQPKMKVTLSAIYEHLPELREHKTGEQMMRQIRGYVSAIDDRITERAGEVVQELVMPHFRDDRRRIGVLETEGGELKELVLHLSRQVADLAGVPAAKVDLKPTG